MPFKKNIRRLSLTLGFLALGSLSIVGCASAPTTANEVIVISGSYGAYLINDKPNPEITLKRGKTYEFEVKAPAHPLWIKTEKSDGDGGAYTKGVQNNGIQEGKIIFTIPADAPDLLYYNCQIHPIMHGKINIID